MPKRVKISWTPSANSPDIAFRSIVDCRAVAMDFVEHGVGRGHDQRVARIDAAVEQPSLDDRLHDLARAAQGRDRITAAHGLAQNRDIGLDAELLLRAAGGHAHAGDHFVEDQQRAVVVRQRAGDFQKVIVRGNDAGIAHHRLHDHGRHVVGMIAQALFQGLGRIPRTNQHVDRSAVHAQGAGHRRGHKSLGQILERSVVAVEDVVARAVIVALEGNHVAAFGEYPGQPQRGHDRLGAGAGKSQQFDVRIEQLDLLGHANRDLGREAELAAAFGDLAHHGVDDVRRAMAKDQRPIGHVQVDVLLSVDVPDARAFAPHGHQRQVVRQHAHRAVVAASNASASPLQKQLRLRCPLNSSVRRLNHVPAALPRDRPDVESIKDESNRPVTSYNAYFQGPSLWFHAS